MNADAVGVCFGITDDRPTSVLAASSEARTFHPKRLIPRAI